ncbi:NAD-dependent epimerase/dehydratase family protein [Thalassobaculum salexigens]|uniref:NAD-dependent epimerase/dehydratase family protein n=1 Tax=Thalassobaculum salexigens TaxID=455360 RepID=UPI000421A274|nr:NAD(P)-dependent oxidoreductase [Thalassobaculum salexigens]
MTTLIAGGCGFIGLAVAERYLEDGQQVVLFDRNPLHPVAKARLDALPGSYTLIQGDIRQAEPIAQAIGDHRVDQVFYGAAVTSGPDREREAPESVIEVNLVGLAHTLKAAAKTGARRLINISSGAAYGTGAFGDTGWNGPLDEYGTREEPFKIYGMTKFGSERLVRRYAELTDLDTRSVRLSTIYGAWEIDSGARDTLSAPMQAALLARAGGTAIFDRRDALDWTYSRHVAGALQALMATPTGSLKSDLFNVTSARQVSVMDMCAPLAEAFPGFSYRLAEPGETATVNLWSDQDRFPMKPDRLATEAGHRLPDDLAATMADFIGWIRDHGTFWDRS